MGFDYHVNVEVAYVQEVGYMNCYSRLATRCLKLCIDPPRTNKMTKTTKKLPGEDLPQEVDDAPFSDARVTDYLFHGLKQTVERVPVEFNKSST